tara:strand:- start:1154 stop:1882 length:729 start_codon:yes stop_codon:yes gene_type:complete
MSFINSLIGGMIGGAIGGPLGAVLGAVIGSKFGSKSEQSYSSNQRNQAAFFTALFACLAKLAKADGVVSREEVEKVDSYIKERFNFPSDQRLFAIQIFNQAKDDSYTFEDYATQLASLLSQNRSSLTMFYELLFELAMADGVLHSSEEKLLKEAPIIFGIRLNLFEELKAKFDNQFSDAYLILGVSRDMSLADIKKEYQKKRREFHPDTLTSKGLPEELLEKAKEKFIQIQQAYEEIEKQKK